MLLCCLADPTATSKAFSEQQQAGNNQLSASPEGPGSSDPGMGCSASPPGCACQPEACKSLRAVSCVSRLLRMLGNLGHYQNRDLAQGISCQQPGQLKGGQT